MSKKYTTVAMVYDFDGTLAKGNIQENSFIPELGMSKKDFWNEVKNLAKKNEMDEILAYMFLLIEKAKAMQVKHDKESFREHGKTVKYFDGVEDYFDRINEYAKSKNIKIEHYIISSGTKEMIEGTSIAKNFEYIYASSFKYDLHNVAEWPAMAINYTTKTQFLFRINKGINNSWDNAKINKFITEDERPVPFNRIIYLGDGDTDIPAMKMVNYQGGYSIAVYPPKTKGAEKKAKELIDNKRATYVAKANYSEKSDLDNLIKSIIDDISLQIKMNKWKDIK